MRAAELTLLKWRENPIAFVQDMFAPEEIDDWQAEALQNIARPTCDQMAFQSCKGPGKTCVEAWIAWWWLFTRPMAKVFATSINGKNLRDNLWSEMSLWLEKNRQINGLIAEQFEWGAQRIVNKKLAGAWYMSGRTWEKSADSQQQSAGLAGGHGDYTLFILDEVSGIPSAVMATAEASLSTGIENKILVAGNPLFLKGPLYDIVKKFPAKWYIIKITADPDNPRRSKRVKIEYARAQIQKWGRNHPYVIVNIMGEFPPVSANALLGPEEIEEAMARQLPNSDYDNAQKRMALDVAAFGDDANSLCKRQGLRVWPLLEQRALDTQQKVEWVIRAQREFGAEIQFIDGTGGFGSGVYDGLIAAGMSVPGGLNPMQIHFASKSLNPAYYNKRSEMWYEAALWVKRGGWLPKDDELAEELQATYTIDQATGKIRIEEKEHMKIRLGRSPDKADSFVLTFALPEVPANPQLQPGFHSGLFNPLDQNKRQTWDYDPHATEAPTWDKDPYR